MNASIMTLLTAVKAERDSAVVGDANVLVTATADLDIVAVHPDGRIAVIVRPDETSET